MQMANARPPRKRTKVFVEDENGGEQNVNYNTSIVRAVLYVTYMYILLHVSWKEKREERDMKSTFVCYTAFSLECTTHHKNGQQKLHTVLKI